MNKNDRKRIHNSSITMIKFAIVLTWVIIAGIHVFAQVGVNSDNSPPDPSAGLDVKFTGKGLLIPRMTQNQIRQIATPSNGLQVFNTDDGKMYIYVGSVYQWKEVAYGTGTIVPSTCGYSITKNHVAGIVAPVSKTVTYGIVTSVPGEPNKCWITSNLGADHQATSITDPTEQSAGWYWQFNRMQGYKHDGTTRTPNTVWISSINENLDWQFSNDPCSLELGSGWHIPTKTEWSNVMNAGGWTGWDGPWDSSLKIHASGMLYYNNGSLYPPGIQGHYWSSTQAESTTGWHLVFASPIIQVDYIYCFKSYGQPIRCLRDL
jgi:hypothetical protein